MCLLGIKESKVKRRFGYKVFDKGTTEEIFTCVAHQPIKKSTKKWQGACWKTIKEVRTLSHIEIRFENVIHLNKISVFLHKKEAIGSYCSNRQVWKVELKYKTLLVGEWEGDDCALVDKIRLVERIK